MLPNWACELQIQNSSELVCLCKLDLESSSRPCRSVHPHTCVPGPPCQEILHVGRLLRFSRWLCVFNSNTIITCFECLAYIIQCGKLTGVTDYCVCFVYALMAAGRRFVYWVCKQVTRASGWNHISGSVVAINVYDTLYCHEEQQARRHCN